MHANVIILRQCVLRCLQNKNWYDINLYLSCLNIDHINTLFVIKDLDKHDPKDIQWVEDPHPLFKCVKDPCGKKARTCTSSEKFRIYPHYFHRKDEIELHLLQKNHIKTNIPRGLKLNDGEFTIQQKDIAGVLSNIYEKERSKKYFLT